MSQVKDYPVRDNPIDDDFLYLITQGNTDYRVLISQLLGETNRNIIESSHEIETADRYHVIRMTFANPKTAIIPDESDHDIVAGTPVYIRNASATVINVVPATVNVTLHTKSGLTIPARGEIKAVYQGNNTWDLIGDLTA